MTHTLYRYILFLLIVMLPSIYAAAADNDTSTKRERNYIKEGNKLYKDGNYAQAEVAFSKAMEANPQSEVAAYNYASALVKQSGAADPNNGKDPLSKARNIYSQLNESANNTHVAEWSAYNLGNMAFNQQQWQQAIDYYKNALRRNPDNDKARENLRLAQLKKQQQDQQNQNQDQNKQDQQNQDQQQDKQDQQQQNQDKNQDDKQDKQDQQKQQQKQDQQQQQQPQQQQISNANMQKILDTVDKAEAATRAKVDADKKKDDAKAAARILGNQW